MTQKKQKKLRNSFVAAMRKRFPRKQVMKHRANKRAKDAKNHWSKEWE